VAGEPVVRRRQRLISRDAIIEAAQRIARNGLDQLSMNTLAAELGVTPMSIYRHVDDKQHLLALLFDAALAEVEVPPSSAGGWETRMRTFHRDVTRALLRYPGLLFRGQTVEAERLLNGYLGILRDGGFDEATAARAYTSLFYLALGVVSDADHSKDVTPAARASKFGGPWPATEDVRPVAKTIDRDDYRDWALDALLAGLRAERRRRRSAPSVPRTRRAAERAPSKRPIR
jgi:AcrR family transcriptional regulator